MKTKEIVKTLFMILATSAIVTAIPLLAQETSAQGRTMPEIEKMKLLLAMHQKHIQELSPAELSSHARVADKGNIAVITGNSKTFFPRNPFDLTGRKISFIPNASGGYDVKVSSGTISTTQGRLVNRVRVTKVNFTSGFSFPYYGVTYTSLLVNGCGKVSFGGKSDSCNLNLLGPPIIVSFDSSYPDKVEILQTPTKFTVTWRMTSPDSPARPDSQVNLLKNGTIEFLYGGNYTDGGRTGISPGNITPSDVKLVDFSNGSKFHGGPKTAFIEEFRAEPQVDLIALLQEFHRTHPQIFDFVTVFTDYSYPNEYRYFLPTQNLIKGIGRGVFDGQEQRFGSAQIQGLVMMHSLSDFPSNPLAPFEKTFNTLQLMGNLHGRRWMPYVKVKIDGAIKYDLLGRIDDFFYDESYYSGLWNFFMDADASVMGGNDITDNGNGTFTTTAATKRYSKLDQYLMGLIPASAVPAFFYAGTKPTMFDFFSESESLGSGSEPQVGVTFSGTRVNVNINQIIQAEGPRVPSSKTSQKNFREAFVYFIRPGTHATPAQLAKINKIRTMWQAFFATATNHHGTMITTLK